MLSGNQYVSKSMLMAINYVLGRTLGKVQISFLDSIINECIPTTFVSVGPVA